MLREERLDNLRERHERRAEKAQSEADSRFKYVDHMVDIMQGEPIKIGHHSEKRHRRDHERVHSNMRKGIEADKLASHSRGMAATVEHSGISIEDDDAQTLLAEKIAGLEKKQAYMKRVNREWRKCKGDVDKMPQELRKVVRTWLEIKEDYWRAPFEGWELSNNNANIKRCKARQVEIERIDEIEDDQEVASGTCEGKAFRFVTDTGDHRLRFESPRLSKDACKVLKRNGFRWSPTRDAWVRLLNLQAISSAIHFAAKDLERLS